jgi:sugar phosphate isomerase/epimerase
MKQKFSLAQLTVMGCPPPEMAYIAKMCGYEYISIRPIHMGLPGEPNYEIAKNKTLFNQTKKALDDTGIKIHDIELAKIYDGGDVGTYEAAFEASAKLGAKHILSSIWTPNTSFAEEQFAKLCDIAAQYDMSVSLEFVTWADVKNLKDARAILEKVNRDNAGIMIDTLHFNRSRVALEELDTIPKSWFKFAHICDGPAEIPTDREGLIHTGRDARLYVGEGGIDIASILNKMPEMVYSIELPHLERSKEYGYAEHARRCIETAKTYLSK